MRGVFLSYVKQRTLLNNVFVLSVILFAQYHFYVQASDKLTFLRKVSSTRVSIYIPADTATTTFSNTTMQCSETI